MLEVDTAWLGDYNSPIPVGFSRLSSPRCFGTKMCPPEENI